MVKVVHYRKKCIGCGNCVLQAPCFWEMDEDGKSNLKYAKDKNGVFILEIHDSDVEKNTLAARDCPSRIIKIEKKK